MQTKTTQMQIVNRWLNCIWRSHRTRQLLRDGNGNVIPHFVDFGCANEGEVLISVAQEYDWTEVQGIAFSKDVYDSICLKINQLGLSDRVSISQQSLEEFCASVIDDSELQGHGTVCYATLDADELPMVEQLCVHDRTATLLTFAAQSDTAARDHLLANDHGLCIYRLDGSRYCPVFVYGTLKTDFANYPVLYNNNNPASSRPLGGFICLDDQCVTQHPHGLVVPGPYFVPFLLPLPNDIPGKRIKGELLLVDPSCLARLDKLEGVNAGYYDRVSCPVDFLCSSWFTADMNCALCAKNCSESSPGGDPPCPFSVQLRAWAKQSEVYVKHNHQDEWLRPPFQLVEHYSAQHDKQHVPRANRPLNFLETLEEDVRKWVARPE